MGVEGGCWYLPLSWALHLHTAHCQTSPPIKHFHQAPPSCTNQPSSYLAEINLEKADSKLRSIHHVYSASELPCRQPSPRGHGPWEISGDLSPGAEKDRQALASGGHWHKAGASTDWGHMSLAKKKRSLRVETLSFIQQRFIELLLYAGTVIKSGNPKINKAWSLSLKNLQSGLPWWRSG